MTSTDGWRPTAAHTRAVLGSVVFAVTAVLARRPDLLVLTAPIVAAAIWSVLLRPTAIPEVRQSVGHSTVREGQATTWHVNVTDPEGRVEEVAAAFDAPDWVDQRPADGQVVVSLPDDGDDQLAVVIRPVRWGRHRVGPAFVVAGSGWNGFRFISRDWKDARELVTLPQPSPFDAAAPPVRAPGLVGVSRSPRAGAGSDFASVRPFQPGDRLRRIHWPLSLRTGTLHVSSTWADHDRHVVLLIDAYDDVGYSGGIDGSASSLDAALRAAAAIAEHFTRTGDRVAVVTIGANGVHKQGPAVGYRHLRRSLEVMANVRPAPALFDDGRLPPGLGGGALVVILSPLLSAATRTRLLAIAARGFNVLAIDCLPADIVEHDPGDPYAAITWRLEILERERHLRRIREAGIAVVPWSGPGSLDTVLRGIALRGIALRGTALRGLDRRSGVRSGRQ